jgi:hypothetical protein
VYHFSGSFLLVPAPLLYFVKDGTRNSNTKERPELGATETFASVKGVA